MYIGSYIDYKANIAGFSSLGVASKRLCQAKNRSISHPTTEFSDRTRVVARFVAFSNTLVLNAESA